MNSGLPLKNVDYLTRVIGYLKRVSNFSQARQQEAYRRYYASTDHVGSVKKELHEVKSEEARAVLKYVNTGIVFQEIPDGSHFGRKPRQLSHQVSGLSSSYLWEDIGEELTSEVIDHWVKKLGTDITCISFMGGDSDPASVDRLACYIHRKLILNIR